MPEVLRLTSAANHIRIQKWSEGGDTPRLLASCDVKKDATKRKDREVKLGAIALSLKKEHLWEIVYDFDAHGTSLVPLHPAGTPTLNPFRVRRTDASEYERYPSLDDALASPHTADSVIEWESKGECCCVDLDFHGGNVPDGVEIVAAGLTPAPYRWWITKSGGLRCVYLQTAKYTAECLAGCAAYTLLRKYPLNNVEILTRTRFPPEGHTHVCNGVQTDDDGVVRKLQGNYTADDEEYREYLAEKGWEVGGRYPHTVCPANPTPRAAGNTAPVVVHDDHVYCYICAADGVTHGSHTPGHFPAARLCGGYSLSLFSLCVEHLTHWEHARHVIDSVDGLSGRHSIARAIYRAALCYRHGCGDGRINSVFTAGSNLLRYDGHWGDDQGRLVVLQERLPARLIELPAAQYVDGEGVKVSARNVEWLKHTGDIARYGYPAIVPIWGVQVSRHVGPQGWKVYVTLPTKSLRSDSEMDKRPTYREEHSRMEEEQSWRLLSLLYPSVSRQLVELLIVAKGCAEVGGGMPPMLFLSGPTGAGKSATVKIAAAICGDHSTEIPFSSNSDRLRAGLLAAKKQGTFAMFDEFLKGATRERVCPTQGMESLLNFTPDSESHMLYVGPVPLGTLPVCVWGDTSVPVEVIQHAQLARRLAWVKLPSRMTWEDSLAEYGIPGPDALRTHGERRFLDAADAILSWVIDRRFRSVPIFRDVVRELGFQMLEDVDTAKEREGVVRAFYEHILAAPVLTGDHAKRYPAAGWKLVDRTNEGAILVDLWKALADERGITSRALDETDLAAVCKLAAPTRAEVRNYGPYVYVRFIEERQHAMGLQARETSVRGSGDTINREHTFGGWEGLSLPPLY